MLQALQQSVHVEPRVPVVEADDEAERDQVVGERVREAAAEAGAAEAGGGAPRAPRAPYQRPSHRVDDPVERPPDFPQLLDAQRVDLGIRRSHTLPVEIGLRKGSAGPLGEHGHARGDIHRRHEPTARLSAAVQAARRGSHADHVPPVHEKAVGGESRQDHHPGLLGAFAEPAHDLADRADVIPVVAHRGGRRDAYVVLLREEIHAFACDGAPEGEVGIAHAGKEFPERPRVDHRAGQIVVAQSLSLLQNPDFEVAGAISGFVALPHQPRQLDRSGQPGGPCAHEHDIQRHGLVVRGFVHDEALAVQRRLVTVGVDDRG